MNDQLIAKYRDEIENFRINISGLFLKKNSTQAKGAELRREPINHLQN